MADAKLTALTEDTTPTSDDLVYTVTDPSGTPASRKATLRNAQLPGTVVQVVKVNSSAAATGTTDIPKDDTIPQNSEGDEFLTLAITPLSTTNVLVIEAQVLLSSDTGSRWLAAALFQDTTANALAADIQWCATGTETQKLIVRHTMDAGTTSATTFKIRGGSSGTGTVTFNGNSGARVFGGVTLSSIVIYEYKV